MKYGSVCSGVEAATVAWHPIGWEPQWFSEIEKFPSEVLQHHYPDVPNFGDMTKFKEWSDDPIDLLVGGTPCQSFSVAGLRKGLDDPRGNLMLTYVAIAARYKPRWLVWENVPGVLSSNRGRDFGTLLAALGKIGYGFAYRICDAQYFGVAQRRRRVFVVGYLGDWRRAAAVLFERESMSGHPAPSREAKQDVAGAITASAFSCGASGKPEGAAVNHFIPEIASTIQTTCNDYSRADGFNMIAYDMKQHHNPQLTDTFSLTASNCKFVRGDTPLIAFPAEMSGTQAASTPEMSPTLSVGHTTAVVGTLTRASSAGGTVTQQDINAGHVLYDNLQVRRLTPIECERLQGFPDNYTQIAWRNKAPEDCPDGPRYKAMGNSMAVPVMRWIGERIQMVEDMA